VYRAETIAETIFYPAHCIYTLKKRPTETAETAEKQSSIEQRRVHYEE
jgi:hypothetical protein